MDFELESKFVHHKGLTTVTSVTRDMEERLDTQEQEIEQLRAIIQSLQVQSHDKVETNETQGAIPRLPQTLTLFESREHKGNPTPQEPNLQQNGSPM